MATTREEPRMYNLARVSGSLRPTVATLNKYYGQAPEGQNIPAPVLNKPHLRFCLCPTRFREYDAEANAEPKWTEFEYIDTDTPRTDPISVTFITKVKSSDWKLVIKVVHQYDWRGDGAPAPILWSAGR